MESFVNNGTFVNEFDRRAEEVSGSTDKTVAVVEGYVVYKRKFKRIVFADILSDVDQPESSVRTECVLREDAVGEEMLRRWARGGATKVALGDRVRLTGELEAVKEEGVPPALKVLEVTVLEQWQAKHEKVFEPMPPPRSADEGKSGKAAGPCKFWVNSGKCSRNPCPYAHDEAGSIRVVRKAWVGERVDARLAKLKEADEMDVHDKVKKSLPTLP